MLITLIIAVIIIVLIAALCIARYQRKKSRQTAVTGTELGEMSNKQVYVGNLSYQVSEQDLKDYFGKYGAIDQVRIVRNYGSGRSKGFGFVTYRSTNEAKNALAAHGEKYQGRTIVVRIAKPR